MMLEAAGIKGGYGQIEVLHGVDLEVGAGQIVTLIGANGAGKTTLLKVLAGVLKPTGGRVTFEGEPITGVPSHRLARKGISMVKEGRGVLAPMTVEENLQMGGYTLAKDRLGHRLQSIFEMFPVLEERRKQIAGTLSGGEQQMLAIGRALISEPRLLMLDEPSLGLAPLIVSQIFSFIENLRGSHIGILLVEQNASKALKIADYGYVIASGRITHAGTGADLLDDASVLDAFLGRDAASKSERHAAANA